MGRRVKGLIFSAMFPRQFLFVRSYKLALRCQRSARCPSPSRTTSLSPATTPWRALRWGSAGTCHSILSVEFLNMDIINHCIDTFDGKYEKNLFALMKQGCFPIYRKQGAVHKWWKHHYQPGKGKTAWDSNVCTIFVPTIENGGKKQKTYFMYGP